MRRIARALVMMTLAGGPASGLARADVIGHPDFVEDWKRPGTILVLPPRSEIVRGKLNDTEPMIKETAALERALLDNATHALTSLGYRVDGASCSMEAQLADRDLQLITEAASDRALEAVARASREPRDVHRGRFTIEDAGLELAARTGADGLLVLRSQSIIHSKGRKALAGIFNPLNLAGATRTRTYVLAGLFDLRDGQLLAYVQGADVGPVLKNPEAVANQGVASAFRGFPRRGVGEPAKKKWREAAPKRELEPVPVPAPAASGEGRAGPTTEEVLAAFDEVAGDAAAVETPAPEPQTRPAPEAATAAPPVTPPREDVRRVPSTAEGQGIRDLFARPPAERPEPELQVLFVGLEGAPALLLRNMAPRPVRVSVDLAAWERLEPGEQLRLDVGVGSHRLLVADAEDERELARGACIVTAGGAVGAEIWPRR